MNQDTLLYTLPQWLIFAAITASIYGWAEQKKSFTMIGPLIMILLGIFACYAIFSGYFADYNYLTPEEIMNKELGEPLPGELPFQARLFPAYLSFIFSGLLAVPAFILHWKNKKLKNTFTIITDLTGLTGFFIIVGELQNLN
jgi:hypothetical protein